jgi:hypothetical protein
LSSGTSAPILFMKIQEQKPLVLYLYKMIIVLLVTVSLYMLMV